MLFFNLLAPFVVDLDTNKSTVSKLTDFNLTIAGMLRGLLFGAALLTFFYMLWGGLDWILSQGDSGKIESARKKITGAVIGFVVLMSVGAIFLVVQQFLGIEILTGGGTAQSAPIRPCAPTVGHPCPTLN